MWLHSAALAWSHSLVSLVGGQILLLHCWDGYQARARCTVYFPTTNARLPRSSLLCHLAKRLVSFSPSVFVQMWAVRTLWHAWGLPMRLDCDSDTAARSNDLQNCGRGLEKGCSETNMSHPGLACSPELLLLLSSACFFQSDQQLALFGMETTKCKLLSILPDFGKCTFWQIPRPCAVLFTHLLVD